MIGQVGWCGVAWIAGVTGLGAGAACGSEASAGADPGADGLGEVASEVGVEVAGDVGGEVAEATDAHDTDALGEVADTTHTNYFAQAMPWDEPVAGAPVADASAAIIGFLAGMGGWGHGGVFQIDFSIAVLDADAGVVPRPFVPNDDWFEGECDADPVPVPDGGALEDEEGYACTGDGDCHLIVRQGDTLYEMWRADIEGTTFMGGCLAVWHLAAAYGEGLRGYDCSSADAAGLPIAPLLFTADEVAAGHIDHAIRFILPNDRIRHRSYVAPATHATGAASGGASAPPYGVRLRLRADYPLASLPSDGARVVARALQTYGMVLADGGQIALTAQTDRWNTNHWRHGEDPGVLGPLDLQALAVTDFDVVDFGAPRAWEGNCTLSGP